MPGVLSEAGLLPPGCVLLKAEVQRHAAIEDGNAVNLPREDPVPEVFVNRREQRVGPELQIVRALADGNTAARVALAKASILIGQDGRRQSVAPQPRRGIAHHAAYLQ